jgi:quercetin dioxygenase-like cupin family protein
MTEHQSIVLGADALSGERGELLLARTPRVALRLWEGEEAGERAPEHANPYDYVAYVLSGELDVTIGAAEPVTVRAGDSYAVAAGLEYSFRVTATAKVIEAVSPAEAL